MSTIITEVKVVLNLIALKEARGSLHHTILYKITRYRQDQERPGCSVFSANEYTSGKDQKENNVKDKDGIGCGNNIQA